MNKIILLALILSPTHVRTGLVRPPYYFYFRPKPIIAATELQVDVFYLGWDIQCWSYAKRLQKRGHYRWSYFWLPVDYYEPDDIDLERLLR